MIKSIRLQNFFGFQDCTINLEKGENVLVGINGSGKSNFFKALELLVEVSKGNLRKTFFNTFGGFDYCSFFGSRSSIKVTYEFIDEGFPTPFCFYTLSIEPFVGQNAYTLREYLHFPLSKGKSTYSNNRGQLSITNVNPDDGNEETENIELREQDESLLSQYSEFWVTNLKYTILDTHLYSNFDTSKTSVLRQPVLSTLEDTISEKGETLPQVLSFIKNNNRIVFNLISDSLSKVNPNFEGIEFQHVGGKIELRLVESKFNKTIPLANISDGTIRFLLLLTILYSPRRSNESYIICIDEPELGLHPDMINTLYRAIEHAAETSQVIISTHSSHLLDYFELENVRVFEKDKNNATVVKKYTQDDFQGWYDSFLPGQMWRSGDIGGNRW